jgi:hypothetical protein
MISATNVANGLSVDGSTTSPSLGVDVGDGSGVVGVDEFLAQLDVTLAHADTRSVYGATIAEADMVDLF